MNKIFLLFFFICFSFLSTSQEVHFSHEAGFYDSPFYLKIDTSDSRVLYSYQNNLNRRSRVYRDSIFIDKNTTISFGLYQGDSVVKIGSRSYFIGFETDFNVVSITISKKALYDSISGIYVDGPNAYYDTILKVKINSNYSKKMEREVYVEMFNDEGKRIINQDAGIRIFGGMTIYYPEKSLRFIARKSYGTLRFNADIFGKGKKEYKQFILRHSGNDYLKTRFKDVLSTTIASKSGIDVQSNKPSHLFVNSQYWGVYNIREKLNEYYIDNNYNCGTESVDMLQAYNFVEEGSGETYDELLKYIDENNLRDIDHYNHVKGLMDVENFANYWIHQIYLGNTDARGNIRFWRSDSLDGKFRWILYDTDLGWGNYNSTLLEDFTSPTKTKWYNPTWSTFLLRNLLKNTEFKEYFINQTSYLLSTTLSTDSVQSDITYFEERYKKEMVFHFENRKKFQRNQGSLDRWQKEVNELKFFALKRDDVLFSQLKKKFNLNERYDVNVIISHPENGSVYINNNICISDSIILSFYKGIDVPVRIVPNIGYSYSGFKKKVINESESINIEFIPNKESDVNIIINEIDYVSDCIEIYNLEDKSVDLSGWKLVDKNNNICIINNGIIQKGQFAVFHKNDTLNYLDSVVYFKISFGLSSVSEEIILYDNKGNLVDSISYSISEIKNSYARNIPFDQFGETELKWENVLGESIGNHNKTYTDIIEKLDHEKFIRNLILFSLVGAILICLVFFYYKKRST